MCKQFRHNRSGRRDGEKLQGCRLYNKDEQTGEQRSGIYEIQKTTQKQTYNNYEYKYPQVGKTGVDAVHESCPQMVYFIERIII
jgi:hypothetical protein